MAHCTEIYCKTCNSVYCVRCLRGYTPDSEEKEDLQKKKTETSEPCKNCNSKTYII